MCEPVSIVMGTAAVASAAYSAYSSFQQADIARESGERNAALALMAAGDAQERGSLEASKIRSAGYRMAVRQKASMLAQGITGAGVLDVITGTATLAGVDAETARNNGAREAWGFRNQADTSRFEGEAAAYSAAQEGYGSILEGVGAAATATASGIQRARAGALAVEPTKPSAEPVFKLKPAGGKVSIDYTKLGY